MAKVKFVGPQGVPVAGAFIYPGETREVSAEQLAQAEQAHPGWFKVEGRIVPAPATPPADEHEETGKDVEHDGEIERVDQPAAERRGGAKRRAR